MFARLRKGRTAEDVAVDFIKKKGFKIIARNFRTRLGEIDIIALDRDILVFMEVRSVSSLNFGHPEESITSRKQQKIVQTAQIFLKNNKRFANHLYRFDFVGVTWTDKKPNIKWIKNIIEVL